jgi:hypothetical protein
VFATTASSSPARRSLKNQLSFPLSPGQYLPGGLFIPPPITNFPPGEETHLRAGAASVKCNRFATAHFQKLAFAHDFDVAVAVSQPLQATSSTLPANTHSFFVKHTQQQLASIQCDSYFLFK